MREAWRWFGPSDPVSLSDIRQTGATDIVSALHEIPIGEAWPLEAIRKHQRLIETTPEGLNPLKWTVVESIPVHEDIKLGRPSSVTYVDSWIASMENLASCGIKVICYNFMPVIDWTRTDLRYPLSSGAFALRFDQSEFAAFDLFMLQRKGAEADYTTEQQRQARATFDAMSDTKRAELVANIIAGLPGRMTDSYSLENFRDAIARYQGVSKEALRDHLAAFLAQILPHAEKLGVRLAIHPDDPPWDLLGLPRVICTPGDLDQLFERLPSPANGMTLCVGTYGSRADNNLPAMARRYGRRIHFAHLRGVKRDADEPRSFIEAEHLDSDVDMVQVISELLAEEASRRGDKTSTLGEIFIRPDHGHQMMDDIKKDVNPGYSGIGRVKGLAEVRGVIRALRSREQADEHGDE